MKYTVKNITSFTALLASGFLQAAEPASQLPPNARVAIIGDSITMQKLYSKYIETYLLACAGRQDVKCFQFGKSGETAGGFLAREELSLGIFSPTVATICYGMNDGGSKPFTETIGAEYETNMRAVLTKCRKIGVPNIVVGTPGAVDTTYFRRGPVTPAIFNDNLAHLGAIDRKLATKLHLGFADVHSEMEQAMTKAKTVLGADYAVCGKADGAHPDANGHLLMAAAFLKGMGMDGNIGEIVVDITGPSSASKGHKADGSKGIAEVESTKYPFCFNCDSKSSENMRSILPFCDFNNRLNRFILRVKNLEAPKAKVTWGSESREFSNAQLTTGINLTVEFSKTPFDEVFSALMQSVAAKQNYEMCIIQDLMSHFRNLDEDIKTDSLIVSTMETSGKKLLGEHVKLDEEVHKRLITVKHTICVEPMK